MKDYQLTPKREAQNYYPSFLGYHVDCSSHLTMNQRRRSAGGMAEWRYKKNPSHGKLMGH